MEPKHGRGRLWRCDGDKIEKVNAGTEVHPQQWAGRANDARAEHAAAAAGVRRLRARRLQRTAYAERSGETHRHAASQTAVDRWTAAHALSRNLARNRGCLAAFPSLDARKWETLMKNYRHVAIALALFAGAGVTNAQTTVITRE